MPVCKWCGDSITWIKANERYTPLSQTGKDHRETCPGMATRYQAKIHNTNHEKAVRAFLWQSRNRYYEKD